MPKQPAIICGREIGTYDGLDQGDTFQLCLQDFEPSHNLPIPHGDVWIDFDKGTIVQFDDEAKEVFRADLLSSIINAPTVES
jgi:hypothetical protein